MEFYRQSVKKVRFTAPIQKIHVFYTHQGNFIGQREMKLRFVNVGDSHLITDKEVDDPDRGIVVTCTGISRLNSGNVLRRRQRSGNISNEHVSSPTVTAMASRNPYSTLNHRPSPAQSSLFSDYPGQNARSRPHSSQGASYGGGGGAYSNSPYSTTPNGRLSPPPSNSGFRPATPNSKGQYATSVLESLEAQNDTTATTLLSQKVGQLKQLTIAIGDEIRDSSSLAQTINDQFDGTAVKLRGTMRRMLRMAESTGVGWKVWLLFFVCVWALFAWVWLF